MSVERCAGSGEPMVALRDGEVDHFKCGTCITQFGTVDARAAIVPVPNRGIAPNHGEDS